MLRLIGLLLIAASIATVFFGASFAYDAYLVAPGPEAQDVPFQVGEGESFRSVALRLEEAGIVSSALPLRIFFSRTGRDASVQAGDFLLKTGMSYAALASALSRAESQEATVTVPEGFTARQIGTSVRVALPHITEEEWTVWTGPDSPLKRSEAVLANIPSGQGLEGYLFPDTYRFRTDADAETVVRVLIGTFARRLAEAGLPIEGATGMDLHETVTLASIVEREVRDPEEMRNVADIFLKRLSIGMGLQADSTVNYVTGKDTPSINLEDTKFDSPYNTYARTGLPPGPISNPGLNALKAVYAPFANPWYYFLTDSAGTVYYAQTYEQHLANRRFLR